jgi:2-iminobutanoate/2-iminopropanoate deaminase
MIVHNPSTIAPPLGAYVHSLEIPAGARTLYVSGQVGMAPDGRIPEAFEQQADRAWRNLLEILASAGMGPSDIVKMSTFMTRPEHYVLAREARNRHLGDHRPTSTSVVVTALADPRLMIEIEVVAAKA